MFNRIYLIFFCLIFSIVQIGGGGVSAFADESGDLVASVKVRGNHEVGTVTILSKIKTRPGEFFNQEVANEDIRRLYATGFFKDVLIEVEPSDKGTQVVFIVSEKSLLEEITIEGNEKLPDRLIREQFRSKEGQPLDEHQLKQDIKAVKKLYEGRGYKLATIEYEIDVDEKDQKATVYVVIHEGGKLKIRRVLVMGNSVFTDRQILKSIQTRADSFLTSGLFDEDTFEIDIERIQYKYWQEGYADVKVTPSFHYEPVKRKTHMYIIFTLEEGKQYKTGTVTMSGNILFPESEILAQAQMKTGSPFSRFILRDDLNRIQNYYFEKGYVEAQAGVDTHLHSGSQVVDIAYRVKENDLSFVGQIEVAGNDRTRDVVIRREMRLKPGDRFDGAKLKRSQQRLMNLGYFEEVTYDTQPGSTPGTSDLLINVKERKTGEFTFGAGFSTSQQFVGFIDITQRNFDITNWPSFTGDGQHLRLRGELGTVTSDFEISFTEPWVFDYPVSFGFDLFNRTFEREDFDEQRTGGDLRLAKNFSEYYHAGIDYTIQEIEVSDISDDASQDIRDEDGKSLLSSFHGRLTRDTTDNRFVPTEGMVIRGDASLFGSFLGGDKDFYKLQLDATKYWPIFSDHVFELRVRLGVAEDFDDTLTVPIYERFFAGGATTVRGYNFRRVGPLEGGDPVGGRTMIIGNAEYTFPLIEDIIKGALFVDAGNVFEKSYDFDIGDLREGIGAGVRVKTPIGPVSLDYGFPLDLADDEEDKQGRFYFNIERGF